MNKTVASIVAASIVTAGATLAHAGPRLTAVAGEFVAATKPGHSIDAQILFLDRGGPESGLVVSGEGKGFDPAQTYVSLIYNTGSTDRGPAACEPTNSVLAGEQMLVGFWKVEDDGRATLDALKFGKSYVALRQVGTFSIRTVEGPPPAGFVLQACSRIAKERDQPPVKRDSDAFSGSGRAGVSPG